MGRWNLPHRRKAFRVTGDGPDYEEDFSDLTDWTTYYATVATVWTGYEDDFSVSGGDCTEQHDTGNDYGSVAIQDYGSIPTEIRKYFNCPTGNIDPMVGFGSRNYTSVWREGIICWYDQSGDDFNLGDLNASGYFIATDTDYSANLSSGTDYYLKLELVDNGTTVDATAGIYNASDTLVTDSLEQTFTKSTQVYSDDLFFGFWSRSTTPTTVVDKIQVWD